MRGFSLYARYALRSFLRGRSRSLFGAFCVAVGIASVVALGLVGGNFRDAVTGNAQKLNRGDVSLTFNGQGASTKDYRYFSQLKARGAITDYTSLIRSDAMLRRQVGDQGNVMIGSFIGIDPKKFPFYDTIKATTPAGVPLARLLASPSDAVVPQTVKDTLHLRLGQRITIGFRFGGARSYTVTGVVPDNAPDPGFGGGLFPYWAMVDRSSLASYMHANNVAASTVYMKTRDQAQAAVIKHDLERRFTLVSPKTVADVEKDSKNSAEGMDKFLRIMGLIAVVIGGIGIINTMLVAARRRLKEIAILKAVGMKGRQVILVFTLESLLLAIAGTVFGVLGGIGASAIVNNVTQSLAGYPIPWSLHTQPIMAGILVGIVATVLFSYLPVLRASRVRPIAALRGDLQLVVRTGRFRAWLGNMRRRPVATVGGGLKRAPRGILRLPKRQGVRTAVLVLFLAVLMGYLAVLYTGLVAGTKTLMIGAIVGLATLLAAGVLTQVFVAIVWLVSKLPSMGRLSVRMAFRSMGTQKRRLGSTLLALCVGILAIGSIAILAQNLKHALAQSLQQTQSYNVSVQAPHSAATLSRVNAELNKLPGIQHRYNGAVANQATLAVVDGHGVGTLLHRALVGWHDSQGTHKYSKDEVSQALNSMRALAGRDVRIVQDKLVMTSGRNLGLKDFGTNHIVVSDDFAKILGIKVGSHLLYTEPGYRVPFTVVGIASSNNFLTVAESIADLGYMTRTGLTSPSPSHFSLIFLQIRDSNLASDVAQLRKAVPGILVLDLDAFLEFTKIIDKLALLPEIIAALALFAGAIIIANTVALAMLERRREIGVMKAVGARRRTILQFLLVENAIVGFLGAFVGVGLAMIAAAIVDKQLINISPSYDWLTVGVLVLLGMVLAVAASALTALPASTEKPMTVLRYE